MKSTKRTGRIRTTTVAAILLAALGISSEAQASINTGGCISGQEGCVKFVLFENTAIMKEYSYIVPSYPQSQYLRTDNLWTIVKYTRNRTRPYFITFGSAGWSGSGCEARVQDANGYIFNGNIAIYAADSTTLPFGCIAF